jgi:DNA-binding response OmpR family regulator
VGSTASRSYTPRILVCDDEDSLRELIRAVLGDGYAYIEARDGDEAVAILGTEEAPDVVLLDLMLPRISGVDVLAMLRSDARLNGVPVIVVSAWAHLEKEALEAGADRFVSKPFDPDDLVAVVDGLLAR